MGVGGGGGGRVKKVTYVAGRRSTTVCTYVLTYQGELLRHARIMAPGKPNPNVHRPHPHRNLYLKQTCQLPKRNVW